MGVRTVRFCDITGVESDDVVHHELQIDQMRVEIDLIDSEYERLLEALRPFMDAGRVEASVPAGPVGVVPSSGPGGGAAPSTLQSVDPPMVGGGGLRDVLTDVSVVMADRTRANVVELVGWLQVLDPSFYGQWTPTRLTKSLPNTAKPYYARQTAWVQSKKIVAAMRKRYQEKSRTMREQGDSSLF